MSRILSVLFVIFLLASAACAGLPVVSNPGFEDGSAGWGWSSNPYCAATFDIRTGDVHSGSRCAVFGNKTGAAPDVYRRMAQDVTVVPNTEYELSVWIKGEDVSSKNGETHFTDWETYTLAVPNGSYPWQKVSTRFKTRPDQIRLQIGLNIADNLFRIAQTSGKNMDFADLAFCRADNGNGDYALDPLQQFLARGESQLAFFHLYSPFQLTGIIDSPAVSLTGIFYCIYPSRGEHNRYTTGVSARAGSLIEICGP
jgi:hypothetical protein